MQRIHVLVLFICLGLAVVLPKVVAFGADVPVTIKIGASVSKTGQFWPEVGPFEELMKAWAQDVNRKGGIMLKQYGKRLPVEMFIYDDKSDMKVAKKVYQEMAKTDKVDLLLGPYSSPLTLVAGEIAESNKIPMLAICASSPKVYAKNFEWLVGLIGLGPKITYRYWDMTKTEGKARTISFVVEDSLHPKGAFKGSKKLAEEAGIEVLSSHIVPAQTADFGEVIKTLREKNPDIVYVSSNVPFAVKFLKEALQAKLNPREYHCTHHGGVFRESLGTGAEQVVGQSFWTAGMKLGDPEIVKRVLKKADISETMYSWGPAYVAAFQVVQSAIERAGTLDHNELLKALKESKVETVLGTAYFYPSGYGSINTYPSQIQQGKYVVIWPPDAATGKHQYPRKSSK